MIKKVLFTGAHHNCALTTLDYIAENAAAMLSDTKIEFLWMGKKFTGISGVSGQTFTPEFVEVSKRNVKFIDIKSGKLYRFKNPAYIGHFLKNLHLIRVGFAQAFFALVTNRPDLVVSFGGHIAVPVVIMAKILGIHCVSHEQTTTIGLANKIISKFVERIYVSWPVSFYKDFSSQFKGKLIYTGLPLRPDFLKKIRPDSEKFSFNDHKPVIFITAGKNGSLIINKLVLDALEELLKHVNIIWAAGNKKGQGDYEEIGVQINNLNAGDQVILKEYFFEDEIIKAYNSADLVICRSGAHTVYELAAIKKYALLIPITLSSNNEQYKNAQVLEQVNLGEILNEDHLTATILTQKILTALETKKHLKAHESKANIVSLNGRETLGNEIIQLLKNL